MIRAILHHLTADEELATLLEATPEDNHLDPLNTTLGGHRIAYTVRPMRGGAVKVSVLELRVVSSDYARSVAIRDRLNALLDWDEDVSGFWYDGVNVMSSVLAGGGELELDGADVFEQFVNYSVKWR